MLRAHMAPLLLDGVKIPAPAEATSARESLRCITVIIAEKEPAEVHGGTERGLWSVNVGLTHSLLCLELRP